MKRRSVTLLLIAWLLVKALPAATPANEFLRYVYGAEGILLEKYCWAHDDLWMLHGRANPAGLAQLDQEKVKHGTNEVIWENIQGAVCIVEIREGKADPAFMLDQTYGRHRQLVLQFIYASLRHDLDLLKGITTQVKNMDLGRLKEAPPPGDMDVYQDLIIAMPVVRVSLPAADKVSRSVSYRVPLGSKGFTVRLVRKNGAWQIDTDAKVKVPLEFFFQ